MKYLYQNLTEQIIKCFFEVYGQLGYGFLEKVYEHSVMIELDRVGLRARNQQPMKVLYKGEVVGDYIADIVVEQAVVIELKAVEFCIISVIRVQFLASPKTQNAGRLLSRRSDRLLFFL